MNVDIEPKLLVPAVIMGFSYDECKILAFLPI